MKNAIKTILIFSMLCSSLILQGCGMTHQEAQQVQQMLKELNYNIRQNTPVTCYDYGFAIQCY